MLIYLAGRMDDYVYTNVVFILLLIKLLTGDLVTTHFHHKVCMACTVPVPSLSHGNTQLCHFSASPGHALLWSCTSLSLANVCYHSSFRRFVCDSLLAKLYIAVV